MKLVLALIPALAGEAATDAGAELFSRCYACHSVEAGETGLEGPNLSGIVGRPVAQEADFPYSTGMRAFAENNPVWTPELLDRFLSDPESLVPGTSMNFPGLDSSERRALIDYLAKQK